MDMKQLALVLVVFLAWSGALALAQRSAWIQGRETAGAERRVALVIGNSAYDRSMGRLVNPVNDAEDMARTLRSLGFEVSHRQNLNREAMEKAVMAFTVSARDSAVALFYFAGHGVQVDRVNYLVPLGSRMFSQLDAKYRAVPANWVVDHMKNSGARANIVILDACRNNPLPKTRRSGGRGLAAMQGGSGTLIAFAAGPGQEADENPRGRNGLYTGELLKNLRQPGLSLVEVFQRTRNEVFRRSGNQQTPQDWNQLVGSIFLAGTRSATRPIVKNAGPPRDSSVPPMTLNPEEEYWKDVTKGNTVEDYREYLADYPKGRFAPLARRRIRRLSRKGSKPPPQVSATPSKPFLPAVRKQPGLLPGLPSPALQFPPLHKITGRLLRTLRGHSGDVIGLAVSPDGRLALTGSQDDTLKVWEIATGREVRTIPGRSLWIGRVAFSPDGRLAISGAKDKMPKIWEVATGRRLHILLGHDKRALPVTFSPDGRLALTGSNDKTLKLWDVATGREVRSLRGHEKNVISVDFSPDGRLALSGSEDKTLKLWDVATGRELRTLTGHDGPIIAGVFSPDARRVLSGSFDKTLKLWDVATGRLLRTFTGHGDIVFSVAFSPDGRLAISGSKDKTLKLWEVRTGRELRTLRGHAKDVFGVVFTPDGRLALSSSKDQTIKVWEIFAGREEGQENVALSPLPENNAARVARNTQRNWRDPVTGMEFVNVPGGAFQMGCHIKAGKCSYNEKPGRLVRLDGFWMGRHEVTQGQWKRLMGKLPFLITRGDRVPVNNVSWNQVQEFIRRLNRQSPGTFRLPSEAQWEYACRSGGKKVTYGTDTGLLSRRNANYGKNKCCLGDSSDGFKNSAPVGSFPPNALGLYDMSGNIREWVQDLRTLYIKLKAAKNPVNEQLGTNRVTRGGNYYYHPDDLRCTKRRSSTPTRKSVFVGFRLIKVR